MSSILNFVTNVGSDIAGTVSGLASELTSGTPPHTILDPCSSETVIRKPVSLICDGFCLLNFPNIILFLHSLDSQCRSVSPFPAAFLRRARLLR